MHHVPILFLDNGHVYDRELILLVHIHRKIRERILIHRRATQVHQFQTFVDAVANAHDADDVH